MRLPAPFGKFELLERIGSGGMAEVFLARSFGVAGFEKRLVIKRIRPERAQDSRFVSLFIHEANVCVHLNHPNIVQVYELGKVGDNYYIAMEFLHGRDLASILRRTRAQRVPLPVHVAVTIAAEACRGLAYAHGTPEPDGTRVGLVHRDISPHNIFVTFTGDVKLVDFGIARLLGTDDPDPAASDDEVRKPAAGKYAYMSPEQAGGGNIDHRTDIFSLTVVLWEMLTGRRLFDCDDPVEKLVLVQEAEVPDPREHGADIDDELWECMQRGLARDRDTRYGSAALMEEDLRAWLYHRRERAGRDRVAHLVRDLFPEAANRNPADVELQQVAAAIERLGAQEEEPPEPEKPETTAPTAGTNADWTAPTDERKRVVVMVIDVEGFTELSRRSEPEVLFKRQLQLLRWIRGHTDAHGGTIQRAADHQVHVFFGVPKTLSDDLQRALDCAVEIQKHVPELDGRGLNLGMAVGIHAGDMTVGSVSSRLRYMARGDTTRLPRRLSDLAECGQILVSEEVFRASESDFLFKRGPTLRARSGRQPQSSFVLEGRTPEEANAVRGAWIRRGEELDLIRDAVIDLAAGRGAALVVRGEPGTGKSRLVRELAVVAERSDLQLHLGRVNAFDRPLKACRQVVMSVLGMSPDNPYDNLDDHRRRLNQMGFYTRQIEAFDALIGARPQRSLENPELWQVVERVLTTAAKDAPIIAVFEDVHGLPRREAGHLARLAGRVANHRVLLLLTSQSPVPSSLEDVGPLIELGALGTDAQRRLLQTILNVEHIGDALVDVVSRTCESNPLYIEELAKYLRSEGRITIEEGVARVTDPDDLDLPGSLAGLIAARIDELDPGSKGAIQIAAVIGPTFRLSLFGEAIGVDDAVPIITDLHRHGLVLRTERPGTWTFASEFVRQSALRGILGVQRRDYHRLVANALERDKSDPEGDRARVLAEHCGAGGRFLDAARYAYSAGQALEDEQALEDARDAYRRGLHWLSQAAETKETWDARTQGEAMLRLRLGVTELMCGNARGGTTSLQVALDVASDCGFPWLACRAHLELGRHYLQTGNRTMAGAHLQRARHLVEVEDDEDLHLDVLEAQAVLAHDEGRWEDADRLWQAALAHAGTDARARARCLIGLSNGHLRTGRLDDARPLLNDALAAAREAEDRILEGRVLNNIGLLHAWRDEPDEAIRYFRLALQVREDIGYTRGVAVNHHNIGDVHFMRGDLSRAYVSFRRSRDLAEEMGWQRGIALNDIYLGYIDGVRTQADEGLARIEHAIGAARRFDDPEIITSGAWLAGRLMAQSNRMEEAATWFHSGLTEARKRGVQPIVRLIETALAEYPELQLPEEEAEPEAVESEAAP